MSEKTGTETVVTDAVATPNDVVTAALGQAGEHSSDGGQSGAFTPPASQEDLDRIVADRLARERKKFADYDDLRAKAKRLDEIEEAAKTEAEKQADALAKANAELEAYKHREQVTEWAKEITKDSHVPASALRGNTREELEAHHAELLTLIPKPDSTTTAATSSVSTTGQMPAATGNIPIGDQIAAAEAAGDKALVATLKAMQLGTVKTN